MKKNVNNKKKKEKIICKYKDSQGKCACLIPLMADSARKVNILAHDNLVFISTSLIMAPSGFFLWGMQFRESGKRLLSWWALRLLIPAQIDGILRVVWYNDLSNIRLIPSNWILKVRLLIIFWSFRIFNLIFSQCYREVPVKGREESYRGRDLSTDLRGSSDNLPGLDV